MFGFTKKFLIAIAMVSAVFALAASPVGAIDGFENPGFEPDPEPPFDIDGIIAVPLTPSGSVEVSCTAEAATARVDNPTGNFQSITISVNGSIIGSDNTSPGATYAVDFSLAENQSAAVEILNGTTAILDEDITRDCLLPDPSYQLLTGCESGQAHARLINNGDDVASMGVSYGAVPYVPQQVAAHTSIDWLLAVDPGETVDFTVKSDGVDLGTESFTFECAEEPAEEVTPPAGPATPETPTPSSSTPVPTPTTPDTAVPVDEVPDTAVPVDETTGDQPLAIDDSEVDGSETDAGDAEGAEDEDESIAVSLDQNDQSGSGLSVNKMAVGGFSLLLLLLAAAVAYASRRDQVVAA